MENNVQLLLPVLVKRERLSEYLYFGASADMHLGVKRLTY